MFFIRFLVTISTCGIPRYILVSKFNILQDNVGYVYLVVFAFIIALLSGIMLVNFKPDSKISLKHEIYKCILSIFVYFFMLIILYHVFHIEYLRGEYMIFIPTATALLDYMCSLYPNGSSIPHSFHMEGNSTQGGGGQAITANTDNSTTDTGIKHRTYSGSLGYNITAPFYKGGSFGELGLILDIRKRTILNARFWGNYPRKKQSIDGLTLDQLKLTTHERMMIVRHIRENPQLKAFTQLHRQNPSTPRAIARVTITNDELLESLRRRGD